MNSAVLEDCFALTTCRVPLLQCLALKAGASLSGPGYTFFRQCLPEWVGGWVPGYLPRGCRSVSPSSDDSS